MSWLTTKADDFSTEQNGWSVERNRHESSAFTPNGGYRISIRDTKYTQFSAYLLDRGPAGAISVTAVLRQSAGGPRDELGVLCVSSRPTGEIQGYALGIGPGDGYVAVRRFDESNFFRQGFVGREGEAAIKQQQHELHILGELGTTTPNEQPQDSSEGEVSERAASTDPRRTGNALTSDSSYAGQRLLLFARVRVDKN